MESIWYTLLGLKILASHFASDKTMWKLIERKARTALKQLGFNSDKQIDGLVALIEVELIN